MHLVPSGTLRPVRLLDTARQGRYIATTGNWREPFVGVGFLAPLGIQGREQEERPKRIPARRRSWQLPSASSTRTPKKDKK